MEDELTFQTDLFSKEHSLYSGIFVCDISACLIVVCLCFQAHSISQNHGRRRKNRDEKTQDFRGM